ncbi:hypothetical protein [Streptomyces sp. H27-D2]|uniref:hypothetical protein n=1 Tax=Streptomyces sp. H27-D2 TaxID=3046304 RepID=UPI002DB78E52|nr:hypothetical protein [Streptomyces sp. H27-D2]MEC4014885.1 hypothetical protein [Streptomyces sp. H27-D2]
MNARSRREVRAEALKRELWPAKASAAEQRRATVRAENTVAEADYAAAAQEWAEGEDARLWRCTTGDGLDPEPSGGHVV